MENLIAGKLPSETTVVVAMSGGVDSSVVAGLLHKQGYRVIGITLQLWDYTPIGGETKKAGTCCALDDVYDARRVCQTLGIPHYVLNYESEFKEKVVDDFVATYLAGATPIPCVRCNERIKFASLLKKAKMLGADVLCTGHYVKKIRGEGGIFQLFKGDDLKKDQSYFLFTTTPEQLSFTAFPLGDMTKGDTRAIAKEMGLHVSEKAESQDICFVPGGDYRAVVRQFAPHAIEGGNFISETGEKLGKHTGILNFTIGQRKGLPGGFKNPKYVIKINPDKKEVVLGDKASLACTQFTINEVNWLGATPRDGVKLTVKVRYGHNGANCTIKYIGDGRYEVGLLTPENQVAPGQAAVFYDGSQLLGGGWIEPFI